MGRKNFPAYSDADWRSASGSLRQLLSNGWPVYADCDRCGLRLKADVERMAQVTGPALSLWGSKPRRRRVGCRGRVTFYLDPPGAHTAFVMTARL